MALRQNQLGSSDIFPQRPHMVVRRDRSVYLDGRIIRRMDVFDHDYRIGIVRHRVASIYEDRLCPNRQAYWRGLSCAYGVRRPDGCAIHRGRIVVRGGSLGPDGRGRDSAVGLVQRHRLGGSVNLRAGARQGPVEPLDRFLEWNVGEIEVAALLWHGPSSIAVQTPLRPRTTLLCRVERRPRRLTSRAC